jgi:L-rhamnose mutarotase
MKKHFLRVVVAALPVLLGILIGFGWSQATLEPSARAEGAACKPSEGKVQRFGSVIGLKPEKKDEYIRLHANTWPKVLKQIRKSNIRNYSIYMAELEGKLYLFSYFEYVGSDFQGDMAKMG